MQKLDEALQQETLWFRNKTHQPISSSTKDHNRMKGLQKQLHQLQLAISEKSTGILDSNDLDPLLPFSQQLKTSKHFC